VSTNWLVATGSVSCYHASMVNFILFTDGLLMKNVHHVSTKQHEKNTTSKISNAI